ncbi:unnamed protein product [Mycena citricolor]|uniref:Conserved oligomeric Golgi complex subunit 7 n=1 Tax=Mycena citricolor TaxID=2018698 RepID=A0AAD2K6I7_9AGAR|nr:unnamed protein product [Mycena citricolor]
MDELPHVSASCHHLEISASLANIATLAAMEGSTSELLESLELAPDLVSWINDTISPSLSAEPFELVELDHHVNHLVSTLDLACEDTSSDLERIIDEVSRGVPRLAYDLHFMKDGAISLQTSLLQVSARSHDSIPQSTRAALDLLQQLDTIKTRMEAARDVLREAESWSTLEMEVISLLGEKSYAKAAERLSDASRSMAVFHNTPEYDPRKTLMVNLQNQLEAALSSALVAAINIHDLAACKNYFSIFANIQRETEFRNYYNGARRSSVVSTWQEAQIIEVEAAGHGDEGQTLAEFMPKFYGSFLGLLNIERTSIPSIFPDATPTLSNLIISVLSALQPTFSQRLATAHSHYGDTALKALIPILRSTAEFASGVEKIMEKLRYSSVFSPLESPNPGITTESTSGHSRRRSMRLSMSWRMVPTRSTSSGLLASKSGLGISDDLEWEQELFQPFLDFQTDFGSLERRLLDHTLREIISADTRDRISDSDRARLLRERAVDVFSVADESMGRCLAFTYGYGAVGLVRALDGFFQSFIDMWTAEMRIGPSGSSHAEPLGSEEALSNLDYTSEDWALIQLSLSMLSSAKVVFDRMLVFETKLRSNLGQVAATFRQARHDPSNFAIASSRGESQLLEQSTLNSAELHSLLELVEQDPSNARDLSGAATGMRHGPSGNAIPLLTGTREGISLFAKACQMSFQSTILSPLMHLLASYASLPLWTAPGDPKAKKTLNANELAVPNFSLSQSDTIHKLCEGLLNLPRLFEDYATDDALSFSLQTLPHIDPEILKTVSELSESGADPAASPGHRRRASLSSVKSATEPLDPELVASAWLSSLGHTLLSHLTSSVLPKISTLSPAGAAQLASDLGYLSTIVRALNVEFEDLERWKECAEMQDDTGKKESIENEDDVILRHISRMRGWTK